MKDFEFNGETVAQVVHLQSANGPKAIDVGSESLTLAAARRLHKWLGDAIEEVSADEKKRKIRFEQRGGKRSIVIGG